MPEEDSTSEEGRAKRERDSAKHLPMRARKTVLPGLYGDIEVLEDRRYRQQEKDIQEACKTWLNTLPGVRVWRQNVGAMKGEYKGRPRFTKFGQPGESDLRGIGPCGVNLSIEVKVPGKSPTLDQILWLEMMTDRGGIAFWCDSLACCVAQMSQAYFQRGWRWKSSWEVQ